MVWAVSLSTTKLISRGPTAALASTGIQSLVGFGNREAPSPSSALPPVLITRR